MNKTIKVWDPLVRVFHWSLAAGFFTAYLTADEWRKLHVYAGYLIAGLVAFRVVWGLVGSRHARFSDFVAGPRAVGRYLQQLLQGRSPRYLGHNPAGGAMVVALLVFLAGTAFTGMVLYACDGHGPLAGTFLSHFREHTVEEVHEFFANTTLFLVFFHVAGVIVSSLLHHENLVRAMVTGRKASQPASANTVAPDSGNVKFSGKL